jgi:iron complex outermembrane receptor protein
MLADAAYVATAAALVLGIVGASQGAFAADAPDSAARLEEIVVSARKREENLQEIPVAVTAFTAEAMARLQIRDMRDVAMFTPGLTFEGYAGGATATPVIRGLAELNITDLESNVSTFFDGIYLPRNYMTDPGLFGLERVEIVKGPQSATYGRNAFAGAINYVTRKPSNDFALEAEATLGTDDLYRFTGEIGGPLIENRLAVRLGASTSKWDGSWENTHPLADAGISPGNDGNLGGHDNTAYFVSLQFTPIDSLSIDASYYRFDIDKEFEGFYTLEEFAGGLNCAPVMGVNQLYCGRIPVKDVLAADPRAYGLQSDSDFLRAGVTWNINGSLTATYLFGDVSATATSFGPSNQNYLVPGSTITFIGTPNGEIESRSHEARIAWDNQSNVKAMVGLYLYETTDVLDTRVANALALQAVPITVANSTPAGGRQTQIVDDKAAFAELSMDAMDRRFNATLQLRYSEETKETRSSTSTTVFRETFPTWAPRLSAQYKLAEDSLLYASAARGTKSGGFNATVFVESERAYDPDTNWTYEIGSKNTFFDRRLQVNGTLYYTSWANLQVSAFPSSIPPGVVAAAITLNSGEADSYGLEVELAAVATDHLTLNIGGSVANPRFKSGVSVQGGITALCDNVVCRANGDVSDNLLPRQSKSQLSAGFAYERTLRGDLSGYVRGNVAWQSSQMLEPQNLASISDRTVANASLGVNYRDFELQLWAKNLLDEAYISGSNVDTGRNNTRYSPALGPRRMVGLTGRVKF